MMELFLTQGWQSGLQHLLVLAQNRAGLNTDPNPASGSISRPSVLSEKGPSCVALTACSISLPLSDDLLLCMRSLASASSPRVLVLPCRSSAVQGRVSSSCLWCKFDSSWILMFLPTILPSPPAANRRQRNRFSPLVIQRRTRQSRLPRMFPSFLAAVSGRETYLILRIGNEPLDVLIDVCPPLFLERLLLCRATPRRHFFQALGKAAGIPGGRWTRKWSSVNAAQLSGCLLSLKAPSLPPSLSA